MNRFGVPLTMKYWKQILILSALIIGVVVYMFFQNPKVIKAMNYFKRAPDTVLIQPFSDMNEEQVQYVYEGLKQVYPYVKLLPVQTLPKCAWYAPRARYKADSIILMLRKQEGFDYVTLGITEKDVSTTKGDVADWGIIGLGYKPGSACVVSTFRLNKTKLNEQLLKVCLHELGHTRGLRHCEVRNCYMRDAEGHNTTDEEHEFCPSCRKKLEAKGWVFK